MKALEIGNVKITSGFWKEYQELILKKVIPYQWNILNDKERDKRSAKLHFSVQDMFRLPYADKSFNVREPVRKVSWHILP